MKFSNSIVAIRLLLVSCFLTVGCLPSASGLSEDQKERLIERIGARLERSAVALGTDFTDWPALVEQHQLAIAEATTETEVESALNAALQEFELSHLCLFSPTTAKYQRNGLRSGIGISIREVEEGLFVTYVIENSPAWRCGIRKLDTITRIDGVPLVDVTQLYGSIGDVRTIDWINNGQPRQSQLRYEPFALADESSMKWLTSDVAVIKIQSFQYRFYKMGRVNRYFRQARDAKAIIIDLRNNRGGLSLYSQHLASKIVARDQPFALRINKRRLQRLTQRNGNEEPSLAELVEIAKCARPLPFSRPFSGEVAVLVDSLSASGADIFPAFLQECGRATVIGETTTGALQLARSFRLPYGYLLYAPVAEILTPAGERLEGRGLTPDITLDFRQTADDDVILQTALQALGLTDAGVQ